MKKKPAKNTKAQNTGAPKKSSSKIPRAGKTEAAAKAVPQSGMRKRSPTKKDARSESPQTAATALSTQPAPSLKTPAPAPAQRPSTRRKGNAVRPRKELKIPAILLEGDIPPSPIGSGPGARYELGASPGASRFPTSGGELPESYGTQKMFLAARDPHWLCASWDFTHEQQRGYNRQSRDGHLILRVKGDAATEPEIHVNPEARNWFVHVPRAASHYSAEIGFYNQSGQWISLSHSTSTFTPAEAPSTEISADFATIPAEVSFQQVVERVQEFIEKEQPLLEAVLRANEVESAGVPATQSAPAPDPREQLRALASGQPVQIRFDLAPKARPLKQAFPIKIQPGKPWTDAQRRAITRLINMDSQRRVWMGSLEITELIRRELAEELGSIAAAGLARKAAGEEGLLPPHRVNISSAGAAPEKPAGKRRKFWFKINAELILYGATEPDANVTIADQPVKLRPDGTFSFRFSLPDGRYLLPARATDRDENETREARLEFSRSTLYQGEVHPHEQDSALRQPSLENIR
jgi:hypothetical protein